MPMLKGSKKSTISKNIAELQRTKPSTARQKAINTLAKKRGITKARAKTIISVAASYAKAGKSRLGKGGCKKKQ